ncbi:hypothetical protein K3495_g7874 [Podosphaera aphanis]|nr:hypothetical protein K3495_g7874 [Podosphaera aphanis]
MISVEGTVRDAVLEKAEEALHYLVDLAVEAIEEGLLAGLEGVVGLSSYIISSLSMKKTGEAPGSTVELLEGAEITSDLAAETPPFDHGFLFSHSAGFTMLWPRWYLEDRAAEIVNCTSVPLYTYKGRTNSSFARFNEGRPISIPLAL